MEPNNHCQLLGVYPEALMSDTGSRLRGTISALWQMENELRFSAWHALTLDKQKAQEHFALAREHLNSLLNQEEPVDIVPTQPPNTDSKSSDDL